MTTQTTTTLAAIAESIAETLEYFDTEFPKIKRARIDSWDVSDMAGGEGAKGDLKRALIWAENELRVKKGAIKGLPMSDSLTVFYRNVAIFETIVDALRSLAPDRAESGDA